jgi:hypothetical protein
MLVEAGDAINDKEQFAEQRRDDLLRQSAASERQLRIQLVVQPVFRLVLEEAPLEQVTQLANLFGKRCELPVARLRLGRMGSHYPAKFRA